VRQQLRDKLIYHHPDFVEQTEHTKELFIETQTASIEVIIQKLQANNLIDDATFAKWWIQNRQTFQPRGKRLLLLELKTKGVSDLDIATALTTPNEEGHFHSEVKESAPPSESDTALLLAQTFLRKHPRITPKEYSTKVARHLASKGFDWDTIKQALTRLNQQTQ
jgi:regulatory protein